MKKVADICRFRSQSHLYGMRANPETGRFLAAALPHFVRSIEYWLQNTSSQPMREVVEHWAENALAFNVTHLVLQEGKQSAAVAPSSAAFRAIGQYVAALGPARDKSAREIGEAA